VHAECQPRFTTPAPAWPRNGARPAARPSVNDEIRRVSSTLAPVINHCGLSQSELSRRSGLSRQLVNSWARKRGSVSLSATVGQLLNVIELTLADLLLDQALLSRKLQIKLQWTPTCREFSRSLRDRWMTGPASGS
jgi:transcriptional regulator with XRE-family HTH domain